MLVTAKCLILFCYLCTNVIRFFKNISRFMRVKEKKIETIFIRLFEKLFHLFMRLRMSQLKTNFIRFLVNISTIFFKLHVNELKMNFTGFFAEHF